MPWSSFNVHITVTANHVQQYGISLRHEGGLCPWVSMLVGESISLLRNISCSLLEKLTIFTTPQRIFSFMLGQDLWCYLLMQKTAHTEFCRESMCSPLMLNLRLYHYTCIWYSFQTILLKNAASQYISCITEHAGDFLSYLHSTVGIPVLLDILEVTPWQASWIVYLIIIAPIYGV